MKTKITLNTNTKLVEAIQNRLRLNNGYCPCALIKNDDTKCMCKEFRESIEEGPCHCGLYIKERVKDNA